MSFLALFQINYDEIQVFNLTIFSLHLAFY